MDSSADDPRKRGTTTARKGHIELKGPHGGRVDSSADELKGRTDGTQTEWGTAQFKMKEKQKIRDTDQDVTKTRKTKANNQ